MVCGRRKMGVCEEAVAAVRHRSVAKVVDYD